MTAERHGNESREDGGVIRPSRADNFDLGENVTVRSEAPEHRACRDLAASERIPVVYLGGPFDGRRLPGNGPFPPSPHRCAKPAGGEWQHYIHQGQGVYRYAGLCDGYHEPSDHPALPCEPS